VTAVLERRLPSSGRKQGSSEKKEMEADKGPVLLCFVETG
jgi:hypothetical protein